MTKIFNPAFHQLLYTVGQFIFLCKRKIQSLIKYFDTLTLSFMKTVFQIFLISLSSISAYSQNVPDTTVLLQSLAKATAAIRTAFENGDATLVAKIT